MKKAKQFLEKHPPAVILGSFILLAICLIWWDANQTVSTQIEAPISIEGILHAQKNAIPTFINVLPSPDTAFRSRYNQMVDEYGRVSGAVTPQDTTLPEGSIEALKQKKNEIEDAVAWLTINGTNINYIVVQGETNTEYEELDEYGNPSKNSCIWAESRCIFEEDQLSNNIVLFGHNWTNWSTYPKVNDPNDVMFAQLTAYQHEWYALSHPYIYLTVGDQIYTYVLFAAFNTDIGFDYLDPNPGDAGFFQIVNGARERSDYIFSTDIQPGDKILTLSTCTQRFGWSRDQRFVVMARMLREGEALPEVTAMENPDPLRPNV